MNFFKKIWKKIKEAFRKLFKKEEKKPEPSPQPHPEPKPEPTPPPPAPEPKPEPPKDPYGGKPPGEYVGWRDEKNHPMNNWEPLKTEIGTIDSFLWKPHSDNTGKPVVVVSCDKVRRMDLHIELYDAWWKKIPTGKQPHNGDSRGNRIHTYARINFYMKKDMAHFKAHAPFNVKFFQYVNGEKRYLPIMKTGKDYFVIENPEARVDKR